MIAALIRWSARNLFLTLFGAAVALAAGGYALSRIPLDAVPDLSDTQVIVYTEFAGQAPQVVEDQVTYPLTTSMLTVPRSKVVRGFSFFGVSFVYVIFEDGTDPYWARSRVLEYLNAAASRLPDGVTPTLGPDATGVGWVYQYAVVAKEMTLAELRSLQDWVVRFAASKAEGVSEVASVGGFVKQYSIVVDPARMRAQGVTLAEIGEAVRSSNMDTGGRTVEIAEFEFMVRGRGYLKNTADIESIVLKSSGGVPPSFFRTIFRRSATLLTYPRPRTANSNSASSSVRPPTSMLLERIASRTFVSGMPKLRRRCGSTRTSYCLTKPPTLAISATPSAFAKP